MLLGQRQTWCLTCAESCLNAENCTISYSDIVYSSNTVLRLTETQGDIVIAFDPHWYELWSIRFDDPLSDAETFRLNGDRLVEIGQKPQSVEEIEGQYMGLIKVTPDGWMQIKYYIKKLSPEELAKMDMTSLLQALIAEGILIKVVPVKDTWFEVDSEKDLIAYHSKFKVSPIT